jgi:hypothetical protein
LLGFELGALHWLGRQLYHFSHIPSLFYFGYYLFIFLFEVLGFELKVYTLNHSTSLIFVVVFFEVGSCELFVQEGFEP